MRKVIETDSFIIWEYDNTEIARFLQLPENTRIVSVQQSDDGTEVRVSKALHNP